MMNLSANMDLRDIKINILAKAHYVYTFFIPPDKSGGNSKSGGKSKFMNRNVALAHSKLNNTPTFGFSQNKSYKTA